MGFCAKLGSDAEGAGKAGCSVDWLNWSDLFGPREVVETPAPLALWIANVRVSSSGAGGRNSERVARLTLGMGGQVHQFYGFSKLASCGLELGRYCTEVPVTKEPVHWIAVTSGIFKPERSRMLVAVPLEGSQEPEILGS